MLDSLDGAGPASNGPAFRPAAGRAKVTDWAIASVGGGCRGGNRIVGGDGELIPRTLALEGPDRTSLWVARPLNVFARLSRPLVLLMNGTGNALLRLFGHKPAGTEAMVHSVEELSILIEDSQDSGVIS